jgi:hypothetical protein
LDFWEREVFPGTLHYCQGFPAYQKIYSFEQVRSSLRVGNNAQAYTDVMVLLDNKHVHDGFSVKFPQSTDEFNTLAIDECRVDTWVIAKVGSMFKS